MDRFQQLRLLEAILFAAADPVSESTLAERMPEDADIDGLILELQEIYANRGVNLVQIGKLWAMRTAADLSNYMTLEREMPRKLSRAAIETLAIIAYHQPITRAEVEEIRSVALSRGTLDILLEAQWIKPKGRRRAPGKPVTWGTTDSFLSEFGLDDLSALPGIDELKAAGLLDRRPGLGTIAMQESESDISDDDMDDGEGEQDSLFEFTDNYEAVEEDESIALD